MNSRPPSEEWIADGSWWMAGRTLLLTLPPLIGLAAVVDIAALIRYGSTVPLWLLISLFPTAVGLTGFFAWTQTWEIPRSIRIGPEGITLNYLTPHPVEMGGPWESWTPKNGSRLLGTVSFQYLETIPYCLVTIPQARAILESKWAPTWELPRSVSRLRAPEPSVGRA